MKALLALIIPLTLIALTMPLKAQTLISNGSLDTWGTTSGTPPVGTPTGWSGNDYQAPGLATGSIFSAFIPNGTGSLFTTASTPVTNFQLSFQFAATDPGSSSNRSLQLTLQLATAPNTQYFNMRTVEGSSAGLLSLQVLNGGTWTTIAANAFSASVFDSASDSFTTLNAYTLTLTANLATASYSISYGAVGGSTTTLANVNMFASSPTSLTLGGINFQSANSTSGYAIDNVSLIAAPEPAPMALLGASGAFLLLLAWFRRSRLTRVLAAT